jgi:hypothetical protein
MMYLKMRYIKYLKKDAIIEDVKKLSSILLTLRTISPYENKTKRGYCKVSLSCSD